mmetsp:Transcript_50592/g.120301  ORF Transcript_50592/g.120301 Transcript_50592/m.120301 type:complete len:84 (-) Transcript_50592:1869-2120(-)
MLNQPAMQVEHFTAMSSLDFPGGHWAQKDKPPEAAYVPASQGSQEADAFSLYLPGGHGLQAIEPCLLNNPASQGSHAAQPGAE